MSPFRWSIAGMMGLVLLCALGFAALTHPRSVVASITYTAALTVLLFATLAALRGRYRTFWLGFAVVGWAYLYIALGAMSQEPNAYILTHKVFLQLFPKMDIPWDRPQPFLASPSSPSLPPAIPFGLPAGASLDATVAPELFEFSPQWLSFARIGHSLAAILHGFVGGVVIVLLEHRANRPESKGEGPSPAP